MPKPEGATEPNIKNYADGVRINWTERVVEVDAVVVLRKGALELLACAPQTREHESILAVPGQPRRIYEALGLIGLSPGSPVRFDDESKKWVPASGQRLRLRLRYTRDGKRQHHSRHRLAETCRYQQAAV